MTTSSDRAKGLIVAVFAVVFSLGLAEIALRVIGFAEPSERKDPFFGFEGTSPAFETRNIPGQGQFYVPAPNKSSIDARFPIRKAAGTYRIFAFGGSTTRGSPYGNDASFPSWLETYMSELYPGGRFEVVNCGHSGFGSSRVLQIIEETADYEPDLFVVYMGQNEFRDAEFHSRELTRGRFTSELMQTLLGSRVAYLFHEGLLIIRSAVLGARQTSWGGTLISNIVSQPYREDTFRSSDYYAVPELRRQAQAKAKSDQESAFKTRLKSLIGVSSPRLDRTQVLDNYRQNIRRINEIANDLNIPVIFVKKARNPKARNVRAAKTVRFDGQLSRDVQERWEKHYRDGLDYLEQGMFADSITQFGEARRSIPSAKDNLINLYTGLAYEGLGNYSQAAREFERRLGRNHEDLNLILDDVANEADVVVLDAYAIFRDNAANGIVGYENYFIDELHPSIEGYRLIGLALANKICEKTATFGISAAAPDCESFAKDARNADGERAPGYDSADANTARGWSKFNQGDLNAALGFAQAAIAEDSSEIQAHLLLGFVYEKMGDSRNAELAWETLKTLYEGAP